MNMDIVVACVCCLVVGAVFMAAFLGLQDHRRRVADYDIDAARAALVDAALQMFVGDTAGDFSRLRAAAEKYRLALKERELKAKREE